MDLFSASCRGDVKALEEIFASSRRFTFSQNDLNNAMQMAAELGRVNAVKFLVSVGADIFADKEYAMHLACKFNHTNVIEYLFSLGSFPVKI